MTATRDLVIDTIWRGQVLFLGFPDNLFEYDDQGWFFDHPYLTDALHELGATPTVVGVGVWKGASVIRMAERMRDLGLNGVVLAVDTWLGGWDHWPSDEWFRHLSVGMGRPMLQNKFMSNVVKRGLTE